MPLAPQWKRVLISGSNLEVNSLTASTHLKDLNDTTFDKPIVFRDPTTGGWRVTSSMHAEVLSGINYLRIGSPNEFESDNVTHSVHVPDSTITASVAPGPVIDTTLSPPALQFPTVFRHSTDKYLERTSSVYYEPFLSYNTVQRSISNSGVRSGSKSGGPNPPETAPFHDPTDNPQPTSLEFPITFITSFFATPSNQSYIRATNGDFMEFRRGISSNFGITASIEFPMFMTPNGADWGTGPNYTDGDEFEIILRQYESGSVLNDTGEFTDHPSLTFRPIDVVGGNTSDPNIGSSGGYTAGTSITGSITGSFHINGPIGVGDRFQLRYKRNSTNIFFFGYSGSMNHIKDGPFLFAFTGSTEPSVDTFGANLSGSFTGSVLGGYSGSLSNITLNQIPSSQGLKRSKGILFIQDDGTPISTFTGSQETTMSLRLHPMGTTGKSANATNKSGLKLEGLTEAELFDGTLDQGSVTKLMLAEGVTGTGIKWTNNYYKFEVDLNGANSGLYIPGGLAVSESVFADGLSFSNGTGSVLLNPSGGLMFDTILGNDGVALTSSLAGFGLSFTTPNQRFLEINNPQIVTSSNFINVKVGTNSQVFGLSTSLGVNPSTGLAASDVNVGVMNNANNHFLHLGFRLDQKFLPAPPSFTSIPDDRKVIGGIRIEGDFVDVNNSGVTELRVDQFETTDQFMLLNSGSSTTSPYLRDRGGIIIQTSSLDGSGNASGSALFYDGGFGSPGLEIGSTTFYRIGWGVTKGRVPWNAQNIFQTFGTGVAKPNLFTGSATDYVAGLSTVKIDTDNTPEYTTDFFAQTSVIANTIGSFYVDRNANPAGQESNVFIFGIFDDD